MVVRQRVEYKKPALADSVSRGAEGAVADAGLALGRSFRAGWGPNGELVHLGKIVGPKAVVYVYLVDSANDRPPPTGPQVAIEYVEMFALERVRQNQVSALTSRLRRPPAR
jgi:hypothetical protein